MRVLQVIDTLEAGGAEKVAVNYANTLLNEVDASYLCCTRREGILKKQIDNSVGYVFLGKRSFYDAKAYQQLFCFIRDHNIDIVHAHGTSYFMTAVLKLVSKLNFKLFWHDHFGYSDQLQLRNKSLLKILSRQFTGVICVNQNLLQWCKRELRLQNVLLLPNFTYFGKLNKIKNVSLRGDPNAIKIICVANIRRQKDHFNLIKAYEKLSGNYSLHLFGHDFKDGYSRKVFDSIRSSSKSSMIYYYGSVSNILPYLMKADIGVLSSRSEGLPLAILEYGLTGLKIVCTKVGDCEEVIGENGIMVPPEDSNALALGIENSLSLDPEMSARLKDTIISKYSVNTILSQLLHFYRS